MGNARPCYNCLNMMKDIGLKKVYYSTGNSDEFICENIRNMVSIQASSSTRYIEKLSNNTITYNKDEYYNNLLKNLFPKIINIKNLEYFIEYNLKNILPHYKIIIKLNNVKILDSQNKLLIESLVNY
jgi:hypothetical protein